MIVWIHTILHKTSKANEGPESPHGGTGENPGILTFYSHLAVSFSVSSILSYTNFSLCSFISSFIWEVQSIPNVDVMVGQWEQVITSFYRRINRGTGELNFLPWWVNTEAENRIQTCLSSCSWYYCPFLWITDFGSLFSLIEAVCGKHPAQYPAHSRDEPFLRW